jgi:nucleoside-diphosphate-sugar epimerase
MRIMVQGGAGFVGSVLVPMLQERGHEVVVVDQLWFGNHLSDKTNLVVKDLFDLQVEDMDGFDRVIFLAGLSNDPMAEYSPAKNFVQNAALPAYLAFIAKQAGVPRFIFASSCSVYGHTVDLLYSEESPATCGYPYGISKLQGERGVMQLQDERYSVIALRQGTVCGHSPRMRFDLLVNTMFKCALTDGKITVNNPAIWRPVIDVRDTAQAFVLAVDAEPALHGTFNVAYDNFTVGQIAELVREELQGLSGRNIGLELKNIQDFRNYRVSSEKAKNVLGFAPRYEVADIVRSLYEHLDAYGDFSSDRFYNIRTFKQLEQTLVIR